MLKEDLERYNQWIDTKNLEWEGLCHRCGACCGALEDPCENLRKDPSGKYYCVVYEHRFGQWHTVSGKLLTCVPISRKLAQGHSWPGDGECGYKSRQGRVYEK
ncbi:MAG: hypothetical protein KGK03_06560 [Candidatus Omnitrophica bacterium]|nr:hypothetical protein [Candidatus Omnitrophota bacterium]MDE2222714.1 hypothetical protein [Candidatus Omnitrophota bacterium]